MAGLVPGVTGFEGLGYPVSKWGTVAFTRYKNTDVSQNFGVPSKGIALL